ncbi:hypothetical protein ACQKGO_33235 [Corallococcus interemptor]|uniref:hypothetical protein n=1 Tax=Corallococcus interemptor TaxID=2316720 RepID=UPI003D065112
MSRPPVPSRPVATAAFQGVTLLFFTGCAAWLVRESRELGGRPGMMALGVAVASGGLALVALGALVGLLRSGRLLALRSRAEMGTYALVLATMGVLALVGLRLLSSEGRPALATFCLGVAGWLAGVGLHAVPALFLGPTGFMDSLGRRTPFSRLEWFSFQRERGELPRVRLQAGQGTRLLLAARLASADEDVVRAALAGAGVSVRKR